MVAAAITGGAVRVHGRAHDHLEAFVAKLRETGVAVAEGDERHAGRGERPARARPT